MGIAAIFAFILRHFRLTLLTPDAVFVFYDVKDSSLFFLPSQSCRLTTRRRDTVAKVIHISSKVPFDID